jgi:radical SAM protein with 4Fe4S-binding SPASM domain
LFVTFTGGEMTLRPDWLELARYARRKGFALRLMTNGTLLTDDDIASIADLSVLAVHISLYASRADVHDRVTGVPGSFRRTYHAVEQLRRADVRVVIGTPVMERNFEDVAPTLALVRDLGCELIVEPRICRTMDPLRDNCCVIPSGERVAEVAKIVLDMGFAATPEDRDARSHFTPWPCLEANSSVYLRADGQLWRCPVLPIKLGSVNEGPFARLWQPAKIKESLSAATNHGELEECRGCDAAPTCVRCAGHAWLEHGSLAHPATIDCQLARGRAAATLNVTMNCCDTARCAPRLVEGLDDKG